MVAAAHPFDVTIWAKDLHGNLDTTFNDFVLIGLDRNPGGSTLGGTIFVKAVNGVANFSGLTLDHFGSGYTLSATTLDLGTLAAPVTTRSFDVTDQLVVTTQPPAQVLAGGPFHVQVSAKDAHGNVDPAFNAFVVIDLVDNPGGSTLGGTTIVKAVNGVADFSDLTLDRPGTGYTLSANNYLLGGDGIDPATTNPFDVTGDITPLVPVSRGKSKRQGSRFRQTLTLVNRSGRNLTGPLDLLLDGLPRKVKVRSATGGTAVRPPRGSPYVVIVPPGGTLHPGQALTVTLTLTAPAGQGTRFTTRVLAGG